MKGDIFLSNICMVFVDDKPTESFIVFDMLPVRTFNLVKWLLHFFVNLSHMGLL